MQAAVLNILREAHLEFQFPFDPCELPQCKTYVDGLYRLWQSRDEEPDKDSDVSSSLPSHRAVPIRQHSDGDQLGRSFGGLSLSPEGMPSHQPLASLVY